ncbi:hypothetical protein OKW22_001303 [Bacilli bacterium PM5-3]|nr:hypothetical protein [Bacilli bacterium PM5-3]MDH6603125.1 hypothetical protein [Bacilli bacterium PM5-9]
MNQKLKEKIIESVSSVLPITIIVLLISILLVPISTGAISLFLVGALLLIFGMGFFSIGAEMAMTPMGEALGSSITKFKNITFVIIIVFLMGFIITVAEPDLKVLAEQVSSIPSMTLICTVAIGVGAFLVIALLRILFRLPLARLLMIFYTIVFVVSMFVPNNFIALAFDSGGVTTGPITVPFILAFGVGLASLRADKSSQEDSFGLVALCSIGPILAVMILGIVYNPSDASYSQVVIPELATTRDVIYQFIHALPEFGREVFLAILPICGFFIFFQVYFKHFSRRNLFRIIFGIIYTYIGLVLFLTGVNVGFIPVGNLLGYELAATSYSWILLPIGMIVGYYIVIAEPAVHVLNKQIEDISEGAIPESAINKALSLGVAASVGLAMIRVLTGISIYWFLIPGYLIALVLSFFVPKMFTGIAFDSGGVASGPMATTFLLPFTMGASEALGGNILTDAFGIIAMVAMTPLIAIQIMGFIYKRESKIHDSDIDLEDFSEEDFQ